MEQYKTFKKLYNKLSGYSDDIRLLGTSSCFATGHIDGCVFRLFQEVKPEAFTGDVSELTAEDYTAWVGIKDETARGSKWPVFYTEQQIDNWYFKRQIILL